MLFLQSLDRTQIVTGHRGLLSSFCGTAGHVGRQARPPGRSDEHVLALVLVPGDGQVAVHVVAATAATKVELASHVVEGPAVPARDRASGYRDAFFDEQAVAALPVPDVELRLIGQDLGQVEVRAFADGREADVEAPAAADALPEPPPEVDAE